MYCDPNLMRNTIKDELLSDTKRILKDYKNSCLCI